MARQKFKWTEHNVDKLNKVGDVLKELSKYKPLTLRQIYYQLVIHVISTMSPMLQSKILQIFTSTSMLTY